MIARLMAGSMAGALFVVLVAIVLSVMHPAGPTPEELCRRHNATLYHTSSTVHECDWIGKMPGDVRIQSASSF
jgi:hypothetical protein